MPKHSGLSDTHLDAQSVLIDLMRRAPVWRKIQVMDQMSRTLRLLATSGLRSRHPGASEDEIRRLLADLLLGPELASKVYGPLGDKRAS
jgi:hypothetical protein